MSKTVQHRNLNGRAQDEAVNKLDRQKAENQGRMPRIKTQRARRSAERVTVRHAAFQDTARSIR